jgi:hypothetical protein
MKISAILSSVLSVCAGFAGVYALAEQAPAKAEDFRVHASACFTATDLTSTASTSTVLNTSNGVVISHQQNVVCPVPDMATELKQNISRVNVHYKKSSTQDDAQIRACITPFNADGASCGLDSGAATFSTGEFTAEIVRADNDMAPWSAANAGHFGYVSINLPAPSTVRGMWIVN